MIQAGGYVTDGREALTDDRYDPPSIEVEDKDNDRSRQVDAAFAAQLGFEGRSQVDDFEMDGSRATGSATFIYYYAYQVDGAGPGARRLQSTPRYACCWPSESLADDRGRAAGALGSSGRSPARETAYSHSD